MQAVKKTGDEIRRLPSKSERRAPREHHDDRDGCEQGKNRAARLGKNRRARHQRQHRAAVNQVTARLAFPKRRIGRAKALRYFRVGVPGARRVPPILRQACDAEVVAGHGAIAVHDRVAEPADAPAHLRLFARDQPLVVAVHLLEHAAPHQRVASARIRGSEARDPVEVEHAIVHRAMRIALAAIAENDREFRIVKLTNRIEHEIRRDDRIAVKKKYELRPRRTPSGVSSNRGARTWRRHPDDPGAGSGGAFGAGIARRRIDINDFDARIAQPAHRSDRREASRQALALVAPDHHDRELRLRAHCTRSLSNSR